LNCIMPYPAIDPKRLRVFPLSTRRNLLRIADESSKALSGVEPLSPSVDGQISHLAERIVAARRCNAAVMLTYGAHLIKNGCGPLLCRLIESGQVTHLATQGAGVIHDWEFAFQATSGESVRENAPAGTFGSWDETGRWLNLAILVGAAEGLGMGEAIGRMMVDDRLVIPAAETLRKEIVADPGHPLAAAKADLLATIEAHAIPAGSHAVEHPYKRYSPLASAYAHRVPFTVHPGIGYDIITNHPLYHGAAIGRAAGTDARIFAASVDRLQVGDCPDFRANENGTVPLGVRQGGVYISVGCAIMSPQVFEKAFSAANNLRVGEGRPLITDHHIAIVDLQDGGGWDWSQGEPPSTNPAYYLRFCKSFYRMGGTLDYLRCDNRSFLVHLLRRLGIGP
jgi:hypothetical protein